MYVTILTHSCDTERTVLQLGGLVLQISLNFDAKEYFAVIILIYYSVKTLRVSQS